MNLVGTNVYVIVAGKLYTDAEAISPNALAQAGKAVSAILFAQTRGDLQRLWTYCLMTGMSYNVTAIPPEFFPLGSSAEFDPKAMTALFEEGRRVALSPTLWRTTPPLADAAHGELPLARGGRDLTFAPRGPQIPIPGPRGKMIPPKYPGLIALPGPIK
jgi:hypothetical protein